MVYSFFDYGLAVIKSTDGLRSSRFNICMSDVPKFTLNTGAEIPAIGFGTWQLAEGNEVISSLLEAIKAGYRLIDTAKIYENEYGVGEAIRRSGAPRDELFVTSKLWLSDLGFESAFEAFEESLHNLGLAYLDLYLIHWPGRDEDLREDAWRALMDIYRTEKAKAVGVSNYEVRHLEQLLDSSSLVPAVNQIEFNPFVYSKQAPILEFCRAQGILVEAYSPLAQGDLVKNSLIVEIAKKYNRTSAQVMLRWAHQHGTVPIPRSRVPHRIHENIEIFDFELSNEDMRAINHLSIRGSVLQ